MSKKCALLVCFLLIGSLAAGCKKEEATPGSTEISSQPMITTAPTVTAAATTAPVATQAPTAFAGLLSGIMSKEDYPIVDGSTATIPLSEAVYQLATGATAEEAAVNIKHTKTSNSYYRLMNKEADLLIVYAPSEQVLADIKSGGYKLNIKPIGKDALVFMANASNPVETLTKDQLVDIYSGKVTNWSKVGGDDKEIRAFQRPADSGSQTLMLKLVMGEIPMMTGPKAISFSSMEGILEAMAEYTNEGNTLGYSVFYYAQNMYNLPELKFMKVNGIEPSLETIYDNTYPYINEFYAVIREDEPTNSNSRLIFDWLTGEEGQTLVKELGYVPVSMNIKDINVNPDTLTINEIPEGYLYIGTSYSSNNIYTAGTVTIYNKKWETVKVFQNSYLIGNTGLVAEDANIPIGCTTLQEDGSYSLKYGLYSPKEKKFIIPVDYSYVSVLDGEKSYYAVRDSKSYKIFDQQGKVLGTGPLVGDGYGFLKKGDYYWVCDYPPEMNVIKNVVYDSNFKLVNKFDEDYAKCELFEDDGTVYFSKAKFLKKFGYKESAEDTFYIQSYGNEPLTSLSYNGTLMLLDKKLNVVAEKQGSETNNSYYNIYNDIFSDTVSDFQTYIEAGVFFDLKGKIITGKDGNSYSSIVNENYWRSGDDHEQILYSHVDGKLNILKLKDRKEIQIDLPDWDNITIQYVYQDIIIVSNYNNDNYGTRIYKGSELLYDLEGNYYVDYLNNESSMKKGILLTSYGNDVNGNKYMMLNWKGERVYESVNPESIISIDDKYIQLNRGSYWGVMDYQGNYFVKAIKNELIND